MAAISTMWSARLLRRSGRELAQWTLSDAAASELERQWARLAEAATPPRRAPDLRYGGLLACHGTTEFLVYADHVERRDPTTCEHRYDPSRNIEALILASAPEGTLPRAN